MLPAYVAMQGMGHLLLLEQGRWCMHFYLTASLDNPAPPTLMLRLTVAAAAPDPTTLSFEERTGGCKPSTPLDSLQQHSHSTCWQQHPISYGRPSV